MVRIAKKRILIVDDEKVVRDFLLRFLSLQSHQVTVADGGQKAIEALSGQVFDFVFLDIRMPGMNGFETLIELKKIMPEARYIMMTGYAVDDLLDAAKKVGIFASIKKPFDINQIKAFFETSDEQPREGLINVLVIDDDESVLSFFKNLLKDDTAYRILCSVAGQDALEIIKDREFDIIFMDLVLKDMSGIELFIKVRDIKPNSRVVLITGYSDKIKDLEQLEGAVCLTKPFDIDKIFSEINKIKARKGLV